MPDEKAPPSTPSTPSPEPQPRLRRMPPLYSGLSHGDLGLKAGFWDGNEEHPVVFRPIVGWIVVMNAAESNFVPFQPVVLNDFGAPSFALNVDGHIGVFAIAMTPEEARDKYALWQPVAGGAPAPAGQSGALN
jgi:hypothetical protein